MCPPPHPENAQYDKSQVGVAVEFGYFPLESLPLVAGLVHVDRFNTVLPWSLFVDPCCASGNKTG